MRIVETLQKEDLSKMLKEKEKVYSKLEQNFLSKYCPYTFPEGDSKAGGITLDKIIILFNTVVKLPITVSRVPDLEWLINEKVNRVNPIFQDSNIEKIVPNEDPLLCVYDLHIKCLDFLEKSTKSITFETTRRNINTDKLSDVKRELIDIFGDNTPIIVYGSAVKSSTYRDIDSITFPKEAGVETYKKMRKSYNPNRTPLLSCTFVPEKYIDPFVLSNPSNPFCENNSFVLNSSIDLPKVDEKSEHYQNLLFTHAALQYSTLRNTLTKDGFNECKGILPRIHHILKIRKFIDQDFKSLFPEKNVPSEEIKVYSTLPDPTTLHLQLVEENLNAMKMLEGYLN